MGTHKHQKMLLGTMLSINNSHHQWADCTAWLYTGNRAAQGNSYRMVPESGTHAGVWELICKSEVVKGRPTIQISHFWLSILAWSSWYLTGTSPPVFSYEEPVDFYVHLCSNISYNPAEHSRQKAVSCCLQLNPFSSPTIPSHLTTTWSYIVPNLWCLHAPPSLGVHLERLQCM